MGIYRSKFKKFKQESTDDQINDEVELIERNRETKNRSKMERLRAVNIEIVNKHKGNIDKDVKEEIKKLQMQVAILRDFLCRGERR